MQFLMALYHDIAKLRKGSEAVRWGDRAEMFRNEIGPELGLPSKLIEDIAFLFDTDLGRKESKTKTSDQVETTMELLTSTNV